MRTYSFDVDFNGRVRPGDQFTVFYAVHDKTDDAPPEVLYTSLVAGGVERRFYRFRTPDDGSVDFYDETGKIACISHCDPRPGEPVYGSQPTAH